MFRKHLLAMGLLLLSPLFSLSAPLEAEGEEPTYNYFLYKPTPNDSLWSITERHLTDMRYWPELQKINQLDNPNHLTPDTVIKIPRDWFRVRDASAALVAVRGEVEITHPDGTQQIVEGSQLADEPLLLVESSEVATAENSMATLEFADGSQLLLQSESRLKIEGLATLGDGSINEMELYLDKGRIENEIPKSIITNTNYNVITNRGTSSVRGTSFRVNVDDEEQAIFEVLDGGVNVASHVHDGAALDLDAGKAALVKDADTPLAPIPLLDPPHFTTLPTLIEDIPIKIEVEEREGVYGYHTLIVPFGGNIKEPISSQVSQGATILGDAIEDGHYHLLISGIDAQGITGQPAQYDFILNARPYRPQLTFPQKDGLVLASDLHFEWNDQDKGMSRGYYLQISKEPEFKTPFISEPLLAKEHYLAPELFRAGLYYWRVAALDEEQQRGPFSETQAFRVLLAEPKLTDSYVERSDISLTWEALEEGTQYRVQVAKDKLFEEPLLDETVGEATLAVPGLLPDTYYFRVQTIAPDGYIDEWGAATEVIVPKRP